MKTLSGILLIVSTFLLCSCSSDDKDHYITYTNIEKLANTYKNGTRSIILLNNLITSEKDKPCPALVAKVGTNQQLDAFLNIAIENEENENPTKTDFFDSVINLKFTNFRYKSGDENRIYFDILTPLTTNSLKGDDIPNFLIDYFKPGLELIEIRDLILRSTGGTYDAVRKEISFEFKGTFKAFFSNLKDPVTNSNITIQYILK